LPRHSRIHASFDVNNLTDFHHGGRGLAGRVNARLAAQFVWQRIYASIALLAPTQIVTVATPLLHQRSSWA